MWFRRKKVDKQELAEFIARVRNARDGETIAAEEWQTDAMKPEMIICGNKQRFRAIEIAGVWEMAKKAGFWNALWGTDIWIDGVPFLKCLVLANIIVWLLMWCS